MEAGWLTNAPWGVELAWGRTVASCGGVDVAAEVVGGVPMVMGFGGVADWGGRACTAIGGIGAGGYI